MVDLMSVFMETFRDYLAHQQVEYWQNLEIKAPMPVNIHITLRRHEFDVYDHFKIKITGLSGTFKNRLIYKKTGKSHISAPIFNKVARRIQRKLLRIKTFYPQEIAEKIKDTQEFNNKFPVLTTISEHFC